MRVGRGRSALAIVLAVVTGVVIAVVWSVEGLDRDRDKLLTPVLQRTYDFGSADLEPGFGAYNSRAETGLDSVSPRMVTQDDGLLELRAAGRVGGGVCLCKEGDKPTEPYGRWVVRARASAGDRDHGFAILLWPNAEDWPVGGEIDFLELPDANRSRLQSSVHYSRDNKQHTHFTEGDFSQWHDYGVTWTPTVISFDLDGRTIYEVRSPEAIPHRPMHLAMQAGRNPSAKHPGKQQSTLLIDWVKTYSLPDA